jgi:hypothetical protein
MCQHSQNCLRILQELDSLPNGSHVSAFHGLNWKCYTLEVLSKARTFKISTLILKGKHTGFIGGGNKKKLELE